jgi:hypothetical protein
MSLDMEMDEKAVLPFLGSLCTQHLPASQVFWRKIVPQKIQDGNNP